MKFDSLKISRSFISKLGADRGIRAIVASIIDLAHALEMNVVAEGIETEKQLRELEKMGCDLGQGYLFHKPLDRLSVEQLLQRGLGVSFAPQALALAAPPGSAANLAH